MRQQLHNITCIKYLAPPSYGLGSFYELARLDFDLGVVSIAPYKNSTGEHFNNITLYIYKKYIRRNFDISKCVFMPVHQRTSTKLA